MAFVRTTLFILTGFLLFTNYLSAQQKITNYTNLWKKVDSLSLKKGLTQSALEEVNKIYALAKKEKQDAQVIKALIYKMGLQDTKEDDEDIKSIIILENEIKTSIEPAKSILYSLLADKYNSYYINNSFELRDRTKTSNFKKEDIATWSVDDFQNKIVESYLSSIKNEKLLQQTKLEPFDQVITKGNA
ncbi:MAG TPA: hypothetical protein VKI61_12015, partial [Chitinophagaceae bacterium]|nr:hypothetical protein [Chitinophagaceae bacterium]